MGDPLDVDAELTPFILLILRVMEALLYPAAEDDDDRESFLSSFKRPSLPRRCSCSDPPRRARSRPRPAALLRGVVVRGGGGGADGDDDGEGSGR